MTPRIRAVLTALAAIVLAVSLTSRAVAAETADNGSSGTASSEPTKKAPPTSEAVKSVYAAENALFQKGFTLKPRFTYVYSGNRIITLNGALFVGALLVGNIEVSQQKNSIYQMDLGADYGITNRLKIGFDVPYLYRQSKFVTAGVNQSTSQYSETTVDTTHMGDVTGSLYYQVVEAQGNGVNVIWNIQGLAPTGKAPYGIPLVVSSVNKNQTYPAELPTGQGTWGVATGFTLIKSVEPAVLFASAEYHYAFARHFDNLNSAPGSSPQPGEAQPGRAIEVSFGTAFSLSRQFSTSFSYDEVFSKDTRLRPDGGSWSDVVGSSSNAASLGLGMTYGISRNLSMIAKVQIGASADAPDTQVSFEFPYHF